MPDVLKDIILRHPTTEDAPAVIEMMVARDIAEYGEPDSSLEDLLDQWSDISLDQDAWLVLTPEEQMLGYAAVYGGEQRFNFDLYTRPGLAHPGLTQYLLELCEARAAEKRRANPSLQTTAALIVSLVNPVELQIVGELGYLPYQYYFGMRISFDGPPPAPAWPPGVMLRNAIPEQDAQLIYDFIQEAFDQPGRVRPSFKSWHDFMLGASNFDASLWFLAFRQEQLVGAILCFDYEEYGWVRQLGVSPQCRGQGIGSALLQYVFGVFYARGHKRVGLSVNANNQNACHLYEQVGMKRLQQYAECRKTLS